MTQKIKCKEMKKIREKKKNDKRNPRREKEKKEILKKFMSICTRIFMKKMDFGGCQECQEIPKG